jgi:hypothetical protein
VAVAVVAALVPGLHKPNDETHEQWDEHERWPQSARAPSSGVPDARAMAAPDAAVHGGSRLPFTNTSAGSQVQPTSGHLRLWPLARRLCGVREQEVITSRLDRLTAKLPANRSAVARPQNDAHLGSPSADGCFRGALP